MMYEIAGCHSLVFLEGDGGVNTSAQTPNTLRDLAYGIILLSCACLGVGGQPRIGYGLDQSTNSHLDQVSTLIEMQEEATLSKTEREQWAKQRDPGAGMEPFL